MKALGYDKNTTNTLSIGVTLKCELCGRSRSLKMTPIDASLYRFAIVTIALSWVGAVA